MAPDFENMLYPVARCRSLAEYNDFCSSSNASMRRAFDKDLILAHGSEESWSVPGWSILASQTVNFGVDQLSGGYQLEGVWYPNLRERLVCPITGLNNRQRLVCSLVAQRTQENSRLWFMEQVTPVYAWAASFNKSCEIIGSEYCGPQHASGAIIDGIRHEDCENLSFADGSINLIVSNEVFEHVANPEKALRECARVLARGGEMIATIPFSTQSANTVVRARLDANGELNHEMEPVYHGNPMSDKGSLVFTDFGWDVLDMLKTCGFSDAVFDVYHNPKFGHYGDGLIVLWANK